MWAQAGSQDSGPLSFHSICSELGYLVLSEVHLLQHAEYGSGEGEGDGQEHQS